MSHGNLRTPVRFGLVLLLVLAVMVIPAMADADNSSVPDATVTDADLTVIETVTTPPVTEMATLTETATDVPSPLAVTETVTPTESPTDVITDLLAILTATPTAVVTNAAGSNAATTTEKNTVTSDSINGILPGYTNIFVKPANDAGIRWDYTQNGTYFINQNGGGLNAVHISTDPTVNAGQVTVSPDQAGTFYVTETGGRGYQDEVVLLLAVNGTLPDDFSVRLKTSGYTWAPNVTANTAPPSGAYTYQASALDEILTKNDFVYGPQSWKPQGADAIYPIFFGEDTSSGVNQFQLAFIDTRAGVLGSNYADYASLTDKGAVKVEYTFTNLTGYAAFNLYAWNNATNNGQGMGWTNRVSGDGSSGYSVIPSSGPIAPVAAFSGTPTSGTAPLAVRFTDASLNIPTSWAWDFNNDGTVDATTQNATYTYSSVGSYSVNLTVTNAAGSDSEVKTGYITVTAAPTGSGLANSAWPKFGHDAQNTGRSEYTGSQNGTPKWSYYAGTMNSARFEYQSPVIGTDGTIYIGDGFGTLHAIYPDNTIKWQKTKKAAGWNTMGGSLAIGSDGTLYAGCVNKYIYAVYPSDGTIKWKSPAIGAEIYGGPAIGSDGTIYIGSDALYAFNPRDGSLKWKNTTGTANYATPAIGPDGTIYIGSQTTGTFYAYNPDGTLKWSNTSGAVTGSAAIGSDGTIYVGSSGDSKIYAWNPDGTLKWSNNSGPLTSGSPAIAKDGTIYVGGNALSAWNPDGTLKWTYEVGYNQIYGAPAIGADGTIYFGCRDYLIYALNPDRSVKWTYHTGNNVISSPAIAPDGTVYVASYDKYLRAFPGVVTFTADQTTGPAPLAIQFNGGSPLTVTAWHWDFGDGTTLDEQNPSHPYPNGGVYTVNLTITSSSGGINTLVKTKYISAYSPPTAAFTSNTVAGKSPLSVTFTDQSTGAPTSWLWDFGDGTTSPLQNPTHSFSTTGSSTTTYTVNLTATNSAGSNTTSKTSFITLYSTAPIISFTASQRTSGVIPLTVQFNDTSTLSPYEWNWSFGDGEWFNTTDSALRNASHRYANIGSYTVNLTATNVIGSATLSKPGFITFVTPGPIDPSYPYLYVANDEGVKFDLNGTNPVYVPNTYSFATMGGVNALHISSGTSTSDVTTTTNQSGTFYFTHTGGQPTVPEGILMLAVNGTIPDDFSVHIRSSGDNWTPPGPAYSNGGLPSEWNYAEGAVNQTFTKDDFIYGPQSWKPFDYPIYYGEDQADPINKFRIMFIDLNAGKAYDNIKIEYEFHNLTSFAAFNAYGWYLASNHGTMIMTNDVTGGSTYGASGYSVIGIPAAPVADFTSSSSNGWHNLVPILFTDTSANVPQSWYWDFGDGSNSTLRNPTHTYTFSGTYAVNLTVTNVKGTDTTTKTITIITPPAPVAGFTADVTSGISPLPVQFNDTSSNLPFIWYWDFGDGTNSTVQNPVHWYAPGTYSVNLTVRNGGGSNSVLKTSLIMVASNGRTNQFVNPEFETGDLTGWTTGAATSVSTTQKHSGNYSVYFPVAHLSTTYISQHVDLTNITNISFWGYQDGSMDSTTYPQYFYTYIDGVQEQTDSCAHAWTQYTVPSSRYTGVHLVQVTFDQHSIGMSAHADDFFAGSPTAPVASFTASPTTGTAPLAVTFTDASANTPTSWLWDFGDGSTATTQNATHTYTTFGTYTVNLTVTNAAGSNTTTKTGYISVSENPADRARLILPAASLYQNTATQLPVQVMNITNGTGISFDLAYDPAVIRVDEITLNQSYESGSNLAVNATPGMIRLSFTRTDGINISAPVPVFFVNTTGIGAVGARTSLNASGARWSDGTFNYRQFDVVNGTLQVRPIRGDFNENGFVDIGDVA
ncbi:MAG: PKD domain-containing protein, partial [Methanoregula sp.]